MCENALDVNTLDSIVLLVIALNNIDGLGQGVVYQYDTTALH